MGLLFLSPRAGLSPLAVPFPMQRRWLFDVLFLLLMSSSSVLTQQQLLNFPDGFLPSEELVVMSAMDELGPEPVSITVDDLARAGGFLLKKEDKDSARNVRKFIAAALQGGSETASTPPPNPFKSRVGPSAMFSVNRPIIRKDPPDRGNPHSQSPSQGPRRLVPSIISEKTVKGFNGRKKGTQILDTKTKEVDMLEGQVALRNILSQGGKWKDLLTTINADEMKMSRRQGPSDNLETTTSMSILHKKSPLQKQLDQVKSLFPNPPPLLSSLASSLSKRALPSSLPLPPPSSLTSLISPIVSTMSKAILSQERIRAEREDRKINHLREEIRLRNLAKQAEEEAKERAEQEEFERIAKEEEMRMQRDKERKREERRIRELERLKKEQLEQERLEREEQEMELKMERLREAERRRKERERARKLEDLRLKEIRLETEREEQRRWEREEQLRKEEAERKLEEERKRVERERRKEEVRLRILQKERLEVERQREAAKLRERKKIEAKIRERLRREERKRQEDERRHEEEMRREEARREAERMEEEIIREEEMRNRMRKEEEQKERIRRELEEEEKERRIDEMRRTEGKKRRDVQRRASGRKVERMDIGDEDNEDDDNDDEDNVIEKRERRIIDTLERTRERRSEWKTSVENDEETSPEYSEIVDEKSVENFDSVEDLDRSLEEQEKSRRIHRSRPTEKYKGGHLTRKSYRSEDEPTARKKAKIRREEHDDNYDRGERQRERRGRQFEKQEAAMGPPIRNVDNLYEVIEHYRRGFHRDSRSKDTKEEETEEKEEEEEEDRERRPRRRQHGKKTERPSDEEHVDVKRNSRQQRRFETATEEQKRAILEQEEILRYKELKKKAEADILKRITEESLRRVAEDVRAASATQAPSTTTTEPIHMFAPVIRGPSQNDPVTEDPFLRFSVPTIDPH